MKPHPPVTSCLAYAKCAAILYELWHEHQWHGKHSDLKKVFPSLVLFGLFRALGQYLANI